MQVATPAVTPIKKQHGGPRPNSGRPKSNPNTFKEEKQLHLPQLPGGFRCQPLEFVKWWRSLTPEQIPHISVYVYRKWPTWDAKRFDPKAVTNIKLYTGPCPFTEESWEREMLTEFGSGDYSFSINDDSVNRWSIAVKGLRDLENYPPLVDVRLLMLDDPANKSYVDFLRQRGRLDGIDVKGTEDGMATNAAFERTIDMAERMTDRVLDLSAAAATRPAEPDMQHRAELRGMELVQEAGKESINFMRETMSEVTRMQNQNANPMDVVDKLVSVAQAITGGNNKGDDRVASMMERMLEVEQRRSERLEKEISEMRLMMLKRDNPDDPDKPKGLLGRLQEKLEDKVLDSLDKSGSTNEHDEDGKQKNPSIMMELGRLALQNAPAIITGVNTLATNILNTALLMKRPEAINISANPTTQSAQPAAPQLPQTPPPPPDPRAVFVARMAPAILYHLHTDGLDGHTLAGWLIDGSADGRKNYEIMKEGEKASPGAIQDVLKLHPPLWNELKDTPEKLSKFLGEFIEFDEWKLREEEEGEDEPEV